MVNIQGSYLVVNDCDLTTSSRSPDIVNNNALTFQFAKCLFGKFFLDTDYHSHAIGISLFMSRV